MVGQTNCLYCGKRIADDVAMCPYCGAVSHFQQTGYRAGARFKFVLFMALLVIGCLFLGLWLPQLN